MQTFSKDLYKIAVIIGTLAGIIFCVTFSPISTITMAGTMISFTPKIVVGIMLRIVVMVMDTALISVIEMI